jgi:hydroxymethylpyrimidine pyrophosphatase-like HAD family hydrolase
MLVVFDIDGTLANIEHRLGFVRSKPKNWAAFESGIPNDKINMPVASVYWAMMMRDNVDIVIASGRNESSRQATVDWLTANHLTGWQKLYMRKAGDFRSDDIVKEEILDQIVEEYKKLPDLVFDDRPRVVDMWRRYGIWVFDCNQSGEEF